MWLLLMVARAEQDNAPYIIYGGVDVQLNRGIGKGVTAADISNNQISISNVQYNWSGQSAANGGLGTHVTNGGSAEPVH